MQKRPNENPSIRPDVLFLWAGLTNVPGFGADFYMNFTAKRTKMSSTSPDIERERGRASHISFCTKVRLRECSFLLLSCFSMPQWQLY